MKVQLLPSSVSGPPNAPSQYLTSFIINDRVAIDAGSLGLVDSARDQSRIKHVLISHSHIDHIASLPIFVDNVFDGSGDCVTIYGSQPVLECLKTDIFNDRVWPDFISMSSAEAPMLRLAPLKANQKLELAGLKILPVPVDHVVPTFGFIIDDGNSAIGISSDTGPTDQIWQHANAAANLKAVFLEAAFPNAMASVAAAAKHLTPALFGEEARKLKRSAALIAVHIKPPFRDQVVQELQALALDNLEIGESGRIYHF